MKKLLFLLTLLALPAGLPAQTATQTVRGKITDAASKAPIPGASLLVVGSQPPLGAPRSRFFPGLAAGRVRLQTVFVRPTPAARQFDPPAATLHSPNRTLQPERVSGRPPACFLWCNNQGNAL